MTFSSDEKNALERTADLHARFIGAAEQHTAAEMEALTLGAVDRAGQHHVDAANMLFAANMVVDGAAAMVELALADAAASAA